jgi:transcriptional regulator with XRE-family HTH domain
LRDLRDESGLTLQQLSQRSGYSKAALSAAESGRHSATWELVDAFVVACGGDAAHWRQLWELARDSAPEEAARTDTRTDTPPEPSEDPADRPVPATGARGPAPSPPRQRVRRRRLVALAAVGTAVVVAALAAWLTADGTTGAGRPAPARHSQPAAVRPAADGTDPYADGCRADAKQLDWQPVAWADGRRNYGTILLMYSPACQAAWGYLTGPVSSKWDAVIVAHRDPGGATAPSHYSGEQSLPGSWGNVLSTRSGCVFVEAYVVQGPRTGPHARTACFRPGAPASPEREARSSPRGSTPPSRSTPARAAP